MVATEAKALHLTLLGYPTVQWGEETLKLPTQKLRALLYFLAVKGQASREELGELLWDAEARHRLRPELYRLKKLTGSESWLELDDTATVRVDTDLALFENLVREERFGEALTLYPERGYLLQGFSLDDAPPFMDWLSDLRERTTALYLEALRGHAEALSGLEQTSEALHLTRLMLELDPLDESAYRLAMRLEYARGHVQAAFKHFETCRRVLREELGVAPLDETLALAREIEKGQALPEFAVREHKRLPPVLLRPPSLIARQAEWARMEAAYQAGQGINISGPSGVGKTRLMMDFARSKGDYVLSEGRLGDVNIPFSSISRQFQAYVAAYPDRPLEPWVSAAFSSLLERDFAKEPATRPGKDDSVLPKASLAFYRRIAEHINVVPVDNVQYWDSLSWELSTPAVLATFGHPVDTTTFCPIVTFRADEVSPEMAAMTDQFASQGLTVHIELEPLDVASVKQLLASLDFYQEDLATKLHHLTGGNPQFIVETLKTLYLTGQLENVPEKITLPERLGYVLSKRLDELSTLALRIAKAVATLEQELSTEELASLLELNAFDVAEGIAELEAAQVLSGTQFVHDTLQARTKQQTPAAVQRLLHGRMASLLEEGSPDPARIAYHYLAADERAKALPWRLQAIEDALVKGFLKEAQAWLEDLLFEAPEDGKTYPQALVLKGRILLQQDLAQAEISFKEARELSQYRYTDVELAALEGLAQCARKQRKFEEANSFLEEALSYPLPNEQRARLYFLQSVLFSQNGNLDDGEAALTQAMETVPGDPEHQMALATLRFHQGRFRDNADLLLSFLRRSPEEAETTLLYNHIGVAFRFMGQPREASVWLAKSVNIWQASDNTFNEVVTYLNVGSVKTSLGHYSEAKHALQHAYSLCEQLANPELLAGTRLRLAALYRMTTNYPVALSYALDAFRVREHHPQTFLRSEGFASLGLAYAFQQELGLAEHYVKEAWHLAESSRHPIALLTALDARIQVAALTNAAAEARGLADHLHALAQHHEAREYLAQALIYKSQFSKGEDASQFALAALTVAEENALAPVALRAAVELCKHGCAETYAKKREHWSAYLKKHALKA